MNTHSQNQSKLAVFNTVAINSAAIKNTSTNTLFNPFQVILLIAMVCLLSLPQPLKAQDTKWPIKFGKYSCTASKYSNGAFEFIPRGSIVLKADGSYTYNGFDKPSQGKFKINKAGNIDFIGGYLDKGTAEKMDRVNKFYVVFPTNPDNRWTATLN